MTELSQFETLNRSDPLFPFPPHRRRHLKSETFCTIVRILSHCYDGESQRSHSNEVVSQEPKQGSGENETGQVTEVEVHGEPVGPIGVESETLIIQRDAQSLKEIGVEQCFGQDRMEIDESDRVNRINQGQFQEDGIECGKTSEDKNPSGNFVSSVGDQGGQCNLLEICMEESGNERQVVVDEDQPNFDVCDSLDLCLDIDIIEEFRKLDDSNAKESSFVERHMLEEVGHEMQLMELEKSVSNCGAMNSPFCVAAEEIEEGQIPENLGLYGQSTDLLVEDAVSLEKKVDEEQTSEAIFDEEQVKAQNGAKDTEFNKNFVETIANVCNGVELSLKENITSDMESKSEMVVCGKNGDAKRPRGCDSEVGTRRNKKQDTRTMEKLNHPALPGDGVLLCYDDVYPAAPSKIPGENAAENQGTLSTKKHDADVHKKGKRGPVTEEKKAKKKVKKRIKRAENNKRLGVKRLKIQPVLKPKTISYCRHYLYGRCQEGEKCKFSHDTVPLTKSKPCCHFARHSCMKGDDCPFDHQLSKYPCNNFLSNGSCSRGTGCMFSHEIQVQPMEGSPSTITHLKSPSLPRSTNSDRQSNLHTSSHQKVDSKFSSTVMPPCKNTEQNVAETILKPAGQTPKGISKLIFGKSSLRNASKLIQAGISPKAEAGSKFGLPLIHNIPDMAQNSNERSAPESKGINFLSFGKASLPDSSSKKPSSLSLSRDSGVQISTFGESSKDKQVALSSQKDEALKLGTQTGQSARNMVHHLSEMPNRTPAVAPKGINFLSFGKAPSNDSSNMNPAASVQERESPSKLQIPSAKPWTMLSSSLHSDKSQDRLADEHGKDAPSSALKALFSSTPNSAQKGNLSNTMNSAHKSLQSMLAFAAKYESSIKKDTLRSADPNKASSSSENTSRGSTILDLLYGGGSKTKQ